MQHAIIGAGNLGIDLAYQLSMKQEGAVGLFTKTPSIARKNLPHGYNKRFYVNPFCYTGDSSIVNFHIDYFEDRDPDYIWITVGGGSVGNSFLNQIDLHLKLVAEIAATFPKSKIVCFSTDYVASEQDPDSPFHQVEAPRSLYALSKKMMEDFVWFRGNEQSIRAIRVGSLYGNWRPEKTFPGKVLKNKPTELPLNLVCPTPTWWLANVLANYKQDIFDHSPVISHLAPKGMISVADWGKLILGPDHPIGTFRDPKRPFSSRLGGYEELTGNFAPDWFDLWLKENNCFNARNLNFKRESDAFTSTQ